MSIQIIEIRQFQGPATVELSGVGVPEIVEVRQGPPGLNSITSATTSDGTAVLEVDEITANSSLITKSSLVFEYDGGTTIVDADQLASHQITFASADGLVALTGDAQGRPDALYNGIIDGSVQFAAILYSYGPGSAPAHREALGLGDMSLLPNDGTATIDVLNATVQGTLTAAHIHGNIAGSVYAHVRAGENLAKGDPVYISGSHGTGANLIAIVSKADASNAAKMPAVGVMDAAVSNAANGHMVITGTISDIDTNAYAVNSVLYVASGGGWTSTPPAANSQPVAIVERSNTNNGAVIVKVNGLASSGGNGASDANKLVRYPSAGSTGSGAIVQATSPTLTSPTLTGTPNFTATNYTFASDARIGFLNNLSSQFVYKNGTIPFAEVFEDFPITGGTHGFITASGTTAYYAPASQAAARYWGAISMTTGATTDNTATITLAPSGGANGQTTSRFGLSHQICFCVNNATSSEFRARLQGSGITFDCAVLFATGVVQLESANIGGAGINTVSVATGLTLAAGDFISGTRYRLFVRCVSATQTEVYLASAPWNSDTWTTLVDTIVTHSTPSITNVSTQPVYFVTTKTNAARIAYVDWVAIRYAIQR